MSNAKRAIMVPVMTLAVCAIAMVGLGFALTTSVTSNDNDIEKFMIDLSSQPGLTGIPTSITANNLFDMTLVSEKNNGTKYTLTSSTAYIMAFSNAGEYPSATLKVKAEQGSTIGSGDTNVKTVVISLYESSTEKARATITTVSSDVSFFTVDNNNVTANTFDFKCNTEYSLKITELIDSSNNNIKVGENENFITSIPDNVTLSFTFTAENNTSPSHRPSARPIDLDRFLSIHHPL